MRPFCILRVDPVARGCWFAVWDREIGLVDYGVRTSRSAGPHRVVLQKLVDRHAPDLVLIESSSSTKRRGKFLRTAAALTVFSRKRGVRVARVTRRLRRGDGSVATKWESAVAIARAYPELSSRVPARRKPWMSEDQRMNLFDALALIENYLALERERAAPDTERPLSPQRPQVKLG